MDELVTFQKVLWLITILVKVGLATLLLRQKNYRVFPLFFAYVLITTMQSIVLVVTYRIWGFGSPESAGIGWGSQFVVILARGLAVAEICWRVLGRYRGIWALAWRTLLASGALVLLYGMVVASFHWEALIFHADRGLELAITTEILILFLFSQYYGIEMEPAVRMLAAGFFLYSCILVLNDTLLEGWKQSYWRLWHLLSELSFLASMLLWGWALRKKLRKAPAEPVLLSEEVYGVFAPEINFRLKLLNEQLNQFWSAEAKRP
jgi:hypothetical protein